MNNNETGLPQLFTLIIILVVLFILNPGIKQVGSMNFNDITGNLNNMAQMQNQEMFSQGMNSGADNFYASQRGSSFNMEKMDDLLLKYLKEKDYVSKSEYGKKMVIYTIVDGITQFVGKDVMIEDMQQYANSYEWTQKYTFVENKVNFKDLTSSNNQNDESFKKFYQSCANFCVIDFGKNTIYVGVKRDKQYLYETLAKFYN